MKIVKKIEKFFRKIRNIFSKKRKAESKFNVNRVNITYSVDKKRLQGKVALILGASSGIGKATAINLAHNGARVIIAARREELLQEVKAEINNIYPDVCDYIVCDVAQLNQIEDAVDFSIKKFGKIDVAVNNVGISYGCDIVDITEEKYNQIMNINTKATLFSMQYQVRAMLKQKDVLCSIVNVGSTLSTVGFKNAALYCASKHSVVAITKSAALDGHSNIRINCICPGSIKSGINSSMGPSDINPKDEFNLIKQRYPVGHLGKPEEVASVISFIASDEASFINGAVIPVDGGFTCN